MPGFHPDDLPITNQREGFCQRATTAGGMTVAFETVPKGDYASFGVCPTPHWGYVLVGRARVSYPDQPDRTEWLEAGQAYHLAPGHTIEVLEDSRVVEFSPAP